MAFRLTLYNEDVKHQCPNCHSFKTFSVSKKWASIAFMLFVLGLFLFPLLLGMLAAIVISISYVGKYRCRQCAWEG